MPGAGESIAWAAFGADLVELTREERRELDALPLDQAHGYVLGVKHARALLERRKANEKEPFR